MAENIIQHTAIEGQRWDQIAHEYYGSQSIEIDGEQRSSVGFLIEKNPGVPIYDTFPGGVVLDIPIIDKSEVITDKQKLPPWKR